MNDPHGKVGTFAGRDVRDLPEDFAGPVARFTQHVGQKTLGALGRSLERFQNPHTSISDEG
jgi:hypothetical protein